VAIVPRFFLLISIEFLICKYDTAGGLYDRRGTRPFEKVCSKLLFSRCAASFFSLRLLTSEEHSPAQAGCKKKGKSPV